MLQQTPPPKKQSNTKTTSFYEYMQLSTSLVSKRATGWMTKLSPPTVVTVVPSIRSWRRSRFTTSVTSIEKPLEKHVFLQMDMIFLGDEFYRRNQSNHLLTNASPTKGREKIRGETSHFWKHDLVLHVIIGRKLLSSKFWDTTPHLRRYRVC